MNVQPATSYTSDQLTSERFSALDPSLPFVAANAAIELDDLIRGRQQDLKFVTKLAELLSNAVVVTPYPGVRNHKALIDPVSADVFNRAYAKTYNSEGVNTIDQLASLVAKLANELGELGPKNAKESLSQFRDFCVALSNYSMTSRNAIYGSSSGHPYKK